MMFAQDDDGLVVCLFASGSAKMTLSGVETHIVEETRYPFDGAVSLTINPAKPISFAVRLRAPTWVTDRFVPGELYRYTPSKPSPVRVLLNDSPVESAAARDGFITIQREWFPGDRVRIELPMPVRFNTCRDEVEANRGRVAVTRGPLVCCAESADNGRHTSTYMVPLESADSQAVVTPHSIGGHTSRAVSVVAKKDLPKRVRLKRRPSVLSPITPGTIVASARWASGFPITPRRSARAPW
jgi:DUF1680 family protein